MPNRAEKIFVTGATGFVGRHLLPRLTAEGHDITALSRREEDDAALRRAGATPMRGSLQNRRDWLDALSGHDSVIHLAAPISAWGDPELMDDLIVGASLDICRSARDNGVRRMIHLSSESVLQGDGPLVDINETHPYPRHPNSRYGTAKMKAEKALLAEAGELELIILRPPFIWGESGQIGEVLAKVDSGGFVWIDNGRAPFEAIHVENLVHTILLACKKGKSGSIYYVTDGADYTVAGFLGPLIEAFGRPVPQKSLPGALTRPLAAATESLWSLLRLSSTPPLSRFQIEFISLPRRYDISRARHDLGYEPGMNFETGLEAIRSAHTGA